MKLNKALHAALVTVVLTIGMGTLSATPAQATSLVCIPLNGASSAPCSHQTTIYANNTSWGSYAEFWSDATVLKLQNDGNLVLYCQGHGSNAAVWSTHTNGWSIQGANLTFWNDGNLALYTNKVPGGLSYAWDSKTWGGSGSIGLVQADGNFVIWSGGRAMWASNTYHSCPGTENYWVGYQ